MIQNQISNEWFNISRGGSWDKGGGLDIWSYFESNQVTNQIDLASIAKSSIRQLADYVSRLRQGSAVAGRFRSLGETKFAANPCARTANPAQCAGLKAAYSCANPY